MEEEGLPFLLRRSKMSLVLEKYNQKNAKKVRFASFDFSPMSKFPLYSKDITKKLLSNLPISYLFRVGKLFVQNLADRHFSRFQIYACMSYLDLTRFKAKAYIARN